MKYILQYKFTPYGLLFDDGTLRYFRGPYRTNLESLLTPSYKREVESSNQGTTENLIMNEKPDVRNIAIYLQTIGFTISAIDKNEANAIVKELEKL